LGQAGPIVAVQTGSQQNTLL